MKIDIEKTAENEKNLLSRFQKQLFGQLLLR